MIRFYALRYRLMSKTESLPQSYRLFMAFIFCAVFYGCNQLFFLYTNFSDLEPLQKQTLQLEKQFNQFSQSLAQLKQKRDDPKVIELQQSIEEIEIQIKKIETRIQKITDFLIPSSEMTKLLGYILEKQNNLSLISLSSLPEKKKNRQGLVLTVHEHGFEITLEGSFVDIAEYLKTIEALPFRIYWDELFFKSTAYPKAELKIRVHTLSAQRGWIGV